MTFGQGAFKDRILDSDYFCSADLKSATDRFPVSLIQQVLNGRLPRSYVSDWKNIMVGFPFEADGKMVSYAVGNPMGFHSS